MIHHQARSKLDCSAVQSRESIAWISGFALNMHLDLSHDLGGVWYLEVLWLARPNLPRQSAIAKPESARPCSGTRHKVLVSSLRFSDADDI
jgi:hypothetical protein